MRYVVKEIGRLISPLTEWKSTVKFNQTNKWLTSLSSWLYWLLKYVLRVSFEPHAVHLKQPVWKNVKSFSGPILSTWYTISLHLKQADS